jgi:uncharacterized protein (TIGR03000 family)
VVAQAASGNVATVVVKAPTDVKVSVDGRNMPRSAAEESFTTPDLEPGRAYQYTLRAEATRDGKPVTLTRMVTVQAGRQSVADFTDLGSDQGKGEVARLTVRVPDDARLFVDGVQCPLTSATRTFETPKLEAGRQYFYTVKAEVTREGRALRESRRVLVEAGKETTVEFANFAPVQAARR